MYRSDSPIALDPAVDVEIFGELPVIGEECVFSHGKSTDKFLSLLKIITVFPFLEE